jgi:hypothetical protein
MPADAIIGGNDKDQAYPRQEQQLEGQKGSAGGQEPLGSTSVVVGVENLDPVEDEISEQGVLREGKEHGRNHFRRCKVPHNADIVVPVGVAQGCRMWVELDERFRDDDGHQHHDQKCTIGSESERLRVHGDPRNSLLSVPIFSRLELFDHILRLLFGSILRAAVRIYADPFSHRRGRNGVLGGHSSYSDSFDQLTRNSNVAKAIQVSHCVRILNFKQNGFKRNFKQNG